MAFLTFKHYFSHNSLIIYFVVRFMTIKIMFNITKFECNIRCIWTLQVLDAFFIKKYHILELCLVNYIKNYFLPPLPKITFFQSRSYHVLKCIYFLKADIKLHINK